MQLKCRTRDFIMEDGERYRVLVDPRSGMPLFYPNLFVTTQVRNRSLSVASMDAVCAALNVLLTHCSTCSIDLEGRIRDRRFLNPAELDAIRDICQKRFGKHDSAVVVPLRHDKANQRVQTGSEYVRLTHMGNYLRWLSYTMLGSAVDESAARQIEPVHRGLTSRRPIGRRYAEVRGGRLPSKWRFSGETVACV